MTQLKEFRIKCFTEQSQKCSLIFVLYRMQFKFISVFKTWFKSIGMLFLWSNKKIIYSKKR